jgi:hypothetical protein
MQAHQPLIDLLVEWRKLAPATDGFNRVGDCSCFRLHLCESVEDPLHLAVPEFTLPANPVIKVRRVTEGKVVEEITSIQGGGVLELVEEDVRCKLC